MLAAYRTARTHAGFLSLPYLQILQVGGADAGKLLHALLSNNLENLPVYQGCLTHLLNPKGKVQATMTVLRLPETFLILTDEKFLPIIQKNIQMRIFRSDVQCKILNDQHVLAVCGPKSAEILGVDIAKEYGVSATPLCFREHSTGMMGFQIVLPSEAVEPLKQKLLAQGAVALDQQTYETLRIEAGAPLFGVDFTDENFSIEANLAKAVSISKGCYLGQEPVARLFSRGQITRQLCGIAWDAAPDTPHHASILQDDQVVGEMRSHTYSPALGKNIALAFLKTRVLDENGAAPDNLYFLAHDTRVPVAVITLPFYTESGINFLEGGPKVERVIAPNPKTIPR